MLFLRRYDLIQRMIYRSIREGIRESFPDSIIGLAVNGVLIPLLNERHAPLLDIKQ